jgi:hypothetical protein
VADISMVKMEGFTVSPSEIGGFTVLYSSGDKIHGTNLILFFSGDKLNGLFFFEMLLV